MRRDFVAIGPHCVLLAACMLVGACASNGETPSLPQLIAAAARSLAGLPPDHPDHYAEPVRVSDLHVFTAITAGDEHTCALDIDGNAYCWGSSRFRQFGDAALPETCGRGTFACSSVPVRVENAPRFTALAASMWSTCGLDDSGRAHCWGYGYGAPPADGSAAASGVPVEIPGGHRFVALDSNPAGQHTCGLTAEGQVWCWRLESPVGGGPLVFVGPYPLAASAPFVAIDVGGSHGCGIDAARNVHCWGANQFGQLGTGVSGFDGGISESPAAVPVRGGIAAELIASASNYSCALDAEGSLHCWGAGFPQGSYRRVPDRRSLGGYGALPVTLWTTDPKWVGLGAGTLETCGLSAGGELFCFMAAPTARESRPRRVARDHAFVAFALGKGFACAIGSDRLAYCWGANTAGQVGRPPQG